MDQTSTIILVKSELGITDTSRDLLIGDIWQNAVSYINATELPEELLPLIRNKVSGVISYEAEFGSGSVLDVTSQTEGKCSWTYNISGDSCREAVYGFSSADFKRLKMFRRTRK